MQKLRSLATVWMIFSLLTLWGCQGLVSSPTGTTTTTTPPPPPPPASLQSINHIVFMAQENRSFDSYFGQLSAYWAANGFPAQQFDGLPANAFNPSYSANGGSTTPISAFHVATECVDNLSPSWDESHVDWNLNEPIGPTATLDGFAYTAGKYATDLGYADTQGRRAMGYYDGSDLNYYYFMASNFATSDRWFAPVMSRTQVNRMYLFAATSQGYVYPPGTDAADNHALTAPTIFDALQKAGVSWKVYYSDDLCSTTPGDALTPIGGVAHDASAAAVSNAGACTYLTQFQNYTPPNSLPSNVVPVSQYLADVQAGTLPSVAFIETGYLSNRDEHPSSGTNVQTGAAYVESLINALMTSPSWKDSVFILTYDEPGGLYDHVSPQPSVNPDGIAPIDLQPNDICTPPAVNPSNCNFDKTGFRVPLIVISPFTKKNYVSHTVADYTAILKFIETRFNVPSLTKRDAAQPDMTEFFDFKNVPWTTPPKPPTQSTSGACNAQVLQ
jgi:phospholipase C